MKKNSRDVIVFGKKLVISYFTSTIIQLSLLSKIIVEVRGLNIRPLVDFLQMTLQKTSVFEIGIMKIGSELIESSGGIKRDIATIEIPVRRAGQLS